LNGFIVSSASAVSVAARAEEAADCGDLCMRGRILLPVPPIALAGS
jgi:hypothetical protein